MQPDLFGDVSLYDYYRKAKLMAVVDAINAIYGRDSLFLLCRAAADPGKCGSLNSQDALPRSGVKYSRLNDSSMENHMVLGSPVSPSSLWLCLLQKSILAMNRQSKSPAMRLTASTRKGISGPTTVRSAS
jgi:hypothetical protein